MEIFLPNLVVKRVGQPEFFEGVEIGKETRMLVETGIGEAVVGQVKDFHGFNMVEGLAINLTDSIVTHVNDAKVRSSALPKNVTSKHREVISSKHQNLKQKIKILLIYSVLIQSQPSKRS